ncbi:expressed unknown protein [Seminavis robusta]|uniref:Phosphoglycerate mutase-like protein n=1 Tax=Seminavis robusta TaxID=568900 RepID=A0A9N8DYB1_9STRA|nr:expressed unknown protein [Seminavis robusta]|eukprot:Sro463_g148230.1 n/a (327) ;mRNA; f:34653-35633
MSTTTTPAQSAPGSTKESPPTMGPKTVFLIRHAESVENQRISSMFSCLGDLRSFSLPKRSDVGASLELLNFAHDVPLSEVGLQQCQTMKEKLTDCNFVASQKIELVVHSPLARAKQTCAELIGCSSDDADGEDQSQSGKVEEEEVKFEPATPNASATKADATGTTSTTTTTTTSTTTPSYPEPIQRVVNLDLLSEKTHIEWVPGNSGGFERRVASFEEWLGNQPESIVAVVGHSQFFKLMLKMPFKFNNVDVYQVKFDKDKTKLNEPVIMEHDGTADEVVLKPQWYDLKLLHSCKETPAVPNTAATTPTQEGADGANNGDNGENLL